MPVRHEANTGSTSLHFDPRDLQGSHLGVSWVQRSVSHVLEDRDQQNKDRGWNAEEPHYVLALIAWCCGQHVGTQKQT